ncbi:MAG: hypothetical protein H0T84_05680 [Tatlockia sp.]|nr:hypothetical protein [Tatlockia sp.]
MHDVWNKKELITNASDGFTTPESIQTTVLIPVLDINKNKLVFIVWVETRPTSSKEEILESWKQKVQVHLRK